MTRATKPVSRVVSPRTLPHGVTPEIVITVYPGGVIGLRELRRRKEFRLDAGTLYVAEVRKETIARAGRRSGSKKRHGLRMERGGA